ncbi:MAG: type II toxin-antitoxin system RelE/ParE family toxin [Lachnospiraceae bacterium]|nr:type II toxin-antitoxin system RelE/ParE family toxin [Lachnospiraceae bacterium]
MKAFEYKITASASVDIEQIGFYIAKNFYVETAISLVNDIYNTIKTISQNPVLYEKRDIYSDKFGIIRIAFIKNYNIYFALDEEKNKVYILRVAHCTMNLVQEFIEGDGL